MSGKQKILVVDDSNVVLQGTAIALEDAGFDVITLDNPLSVAHVLRKEQPVLMLIDVNMPTLTGDTVTSIVAKRGAGPTKILLHSDVEELELRVRARQCGADGYIRKTGDETDFIRQVQQALAQV
jgi:DNA-binding response OmpR family regulator